MTVNARMRDLARSLIEAAARLALGEPARVVPVRKLNRLEELERREQLQQAERAGDTAYLRAELAKSQLTAGDLDALAKMSRPLSDWPDEDLEDCFTPTNATCGSGN